MIESVSLDHARRLESVLTHRRLWLAYLVVFVTSACTLVIELVAGRMLAPYIGVSLYTWTSIIGVVLAGIAVGNYAGGVLADRRPHRTTLGGLLLVAGASSLAVLGLIQIVAPMRLPEGPFFLQVLLQTTAVFFVPSAILGMISPVVIRLSLDDLAQAGHTVGKIYACSALGSIFGTFATGYLLIGWFGTRTIVLTVGITLVAMAAVFGGLGSTTRARIVVLAGLGTILIAIHARGLLNSPCNVTESRYYCIGYSDDVDDAHPVRRLHLDQLIHSRSNLEDPTYLADAYVRIYGAVTDAIAASRPALRTLFIGGGGYTFPRYLEAVYPRATIAVAEIDPAVTEAVYTYMGLARSSRVVTYTNDARLVVDDLLASGEQFDVIYGDAFNDVSVPYHLTTQEFTGKLQRLLSPSGAYLVNIVDNPARGEFLRTYTRTAAAVFPYVAILSQGVGAPLMAPNTYVVVASATPLNLDHLDSPGSSTRVVTPERVAAWVAQGGPVILTDDYAPVDNLMAPVFSERAAGR
jgi:spermidine synthase